MHAISAVGLASYGGGFANTAAMNSCCQACFWAGLLLLAVAFWQLSKAPGPNK